MIRVSLSTGETRNIELETTDGETAWRRIVDGHERQRACIRALSVVVHDGGREVAVYAFPAPERLAPVWWEAELVREAGRIVRECVVCYCGTVKITQTVYRNERGPRVSRVDVAHVGKLRFRPNRLNLG